MKQDLEPLELTDYYYKVKYIVKMAYKVLRSRKQVTFLFTPIGDDWKIESYANNTPPIAHRLYFNAIEGIFFKKDAPEGTSTKDSSI